MSHDFKLPDGRPLRVLQDVRVAIRENEVVALLGPTGCGKSTLLRILAGLQHPTHGEVLQHGQRLDGLNPGVAIVFQSFALYPWMTVMENVATVLQAAGLGEAEVVSRAREAIGLEDGRQRTLEEVGREFGVTRERIRQIEAKALRKLRHPTRSRKLRDYFDH